MPDPWTMGNLAAVSDAEPLEAAFTAIDACDAALEQLHAMCCEPARNPQMIAAAETLAAARGQLEAVRSGEDTADQLIGMLEDLGGRIGRLQVGCCTPQRLPLYEDVLGGLTTVQLTVNRARGTGH